MATVNGSKFPSVADELIGLHHLEWRLLSPRIPFMKIYAAPRGGQKKIKGNVVNVVSNTQGTYTKLPKMSNEQDTIAVKLKRNTIRVPWQAPVISLLVGKFSERLESGTTILHSVLSNVTRTLAPREYKWVHTVCGTNTRAHQSFVKVNQVSKTS